MLGIVPHACDSSAQEAEAPLSQVRGQPGPHAEYWASMDHRAKPCLEQQNK